jgi:hypothetical protein
LQLLYTKLRHLGDAAYFDHRVLGYIDSLRLVIAKLLDPTLKLDDAIRVFVAIQVWSATEFIAGSAHRRKRPPKSSLSTTSLVERYA